MVGRTVPVAAVVLFEDPHVLIALVANIEGRLRHERNTIPVHEQTVLLDTHVIGIEGHVHI